MSFPVGPPLYRLARNELQLITELALRAPATIADGVNIRPLLERCVDIVNGQYDLVTDVPAPVPVDGELLPFDMGVDANGSPVSG